MNCGNPHLSVPIFLSPSVTVSSFRCWRSSVLAESALCLAQVSLDPLTFQSREE